MEAESKQQADAMDRALWDQVYKSSAKSNRIETSSAKHKLMDRIPFSLQLIRNKLKTGRLKPDQCLDESAADAALSTGGEGGHGE